MQDDKNQILSSFDISRLLHRLVEGNHVEDDHELLKKLQDIIKAVFYN